MNTSSLSTITTTTAPSRKTTSKSHAAKPTTQKSTANKTTAATQKAKVTKKRAKAAQPGRPSSPRGVGLFARTLLTTKLSYDAIIARIRTKFPDAKTSVQCLRWYATKMREENVDMPNRPRKPRVDRPIIGH